MIDADTTLLLVVVARRHEDNDSPIYAIYGIFFLILPLRKDDFLVKGEVAGVYVTDRSMLSELLGLSSNPYFDLSD